MSRFVQGVALMSLALLPASALAAAKSKAKSTETGGLKQTMADLTDSINQKGAYSYEVEKTEAPLAKGTVSGNLTVGSFDAGGCVLVLKRHVSLQSHGDASLHNETSDTVVTVPLKEIDPSKVTLDPLPTTFRKVWAPTSGMDYLQIGLAAKGTGSPIKLAEKRTTEDQDGGAAKTSNTENLNDRVPSTYVIFTDADVADKAQASFKHAVELCQKGLR